MKPIYYSTGEYGLSSLATEAMRMYHEEEDGYIPTSFFARVKALLAKAKRLEQEQALLLKQLMQEQKAEAAAAAKAAEAASVAEAAKKHAA
jgi:hypothetical protein